MIQWGTIENKRTTEKFAMATKADKKGGGAKTSRSETVTVRLDPKMRYLADIAARVQRRTLSSYIEWAVEESLKNVTLDSYSDNHEITEDGSNTVAMVGRALWDVEEADRFFMLATTQPGLLTHEEQLLWKLMSDPKNGLWEVSGGSGKPDFPAMRAWFPNAKFAVSTGADLDIVRAALNGETEAVQAIGLDKWAENRKK